MKVDVKCFAGLAQKYSCDYRKASVLNLEAGSTIKEAMDALGIPESEVRITFVNSKVAQSHQALKNGDRMSLAPSTGGM